MSKKDTGKVEEPSLRRILVAFDGSGSAMKAARLAIEIAKVSRLDLVVLNVISSSCTIFTPSGLVAKELAGHDASVRKELEDLLSEVVQIASNQGLNARFDMLHAYSAVQGIIDYASKRDVDLIVVGTRGLGTFRKLLFGSVSSGVLAHARCSVLLVR